VGGRDKEGEREVERGQEGGGEREVEREGEILRGAGQMAA
jgi:hypothetical protein